MQFEKLAVLSELQAVAFFGDSEWWFKKAETILFLPSLRKLVLIDTARYIRCQIFFATNTARTAQ